MDLYLQVESILSNEIPLVSNLSNVSAVLNQLDDINWVGFYLVKDDYLYLGPFQGEIACTIIKKGKGVCGTSLEKKESIVVSDVTKITNHIACSSKTRSEIVVPIIKNNNVVGVIDVDSTTINRFGNKEKELLEKVASRLSDLF